jgi:CHAT domain-containing protein/Tfp pilus assembly protein PilF
MLVALLLGAFGVQAQNWAVFDQQAEALYNRGDLKEAIRVARLAVEAASNPKQSGRSLDRLGFFEYTAGNLKDGEVFLRRALEIRRVDAGVESAEYAESANDLALVCRDSGKLVEARGLAEQAVTVRSRLLGPRHLRLAESLNTLGSTVALMGEYEAGISKLEEARSIHEAQPGAELSEEYGTLCVNLAGTYQRTGKYEKAHDLFEKGLAVLRKKPGVNHPVYSASLVAFATLQADLGQYSAAERSYNECNRLLLAQLGEQHPVYAAFLNNRAALYTALGNWKVAEQDYRKSLELKRKLYGPDALTIGASLRNLARLVSVRNAGEGAALFREAVDLYAKNPKAPPFDYTSALLGLGQTQRSRGDLSGARTTLERASEVAAAGLGIRHPLRAALLRDLGLVHQSAREYAQAEKRLKEAIAIVEEVQGEGHPDLAAYLERLGTLYEEAGNYRTAEPVYRRSLEISDRTLADMLRVGSESNKSAVLANVEDAMLKIVSFQRRAGDQVPAARALAFEAVARRKGRVLEQLHHWGQSLRESADANVQRRFAQRQALLECEASLTVASGYRDLKPAVVGTCALAGTDLEGRYERLLQDLRTRWTDDTGRQALQAVAVLQRRVEALETELSRDVPQFRSMLRPARLEDIQSRIGLDERLIEFAGWVEGGTRRYGAFVVGRSGDPAWADLGPAAAIDRAVRDLIVAANDWSAALAAREQRSAASAEETARDALRTLSEKLKPVTAEVVRRSGVHRLRVAPDGMLNLIPFGALLDGRGRFLIERFAISYVSAGREVAGVSESGTIPLGRMVVAVSPGAVRGSPTAGAFRADRLERLAAADLEARDVQRWMPRSELLREHEATEKRVKALRHPAVLHIIGHGIVRGNEDCRSESASPGCELSGMNPAARVMSLSAIVLEEAYGRGGESSQDGLLTALELQTLDLEGTEMLVLSQCRMADGVPSSGEGVYGIRRAAAIAGVKTFVAPLWKIADPTQRALMDSFYGKLRSGQGRAEALRQAQLALLRQPATAGFLHWAPVILSGEPGPLPGELFTK